MPQTKGGIDEAQRAAPTARLYEAIFLISQGVAADLGGFIEHIDAIFGRAGAEAVAMKKWDERRLAYEIEGQKRGIYILAYFNAAPESIAKLENDANISERIMRFMVIRADHMTQDEAQAHDDRDGLATEAKMRGQRSDEKETRGSGVKLGAPEPAKPETTPETTPETEPEPAREQAAGEEPAAGSTEPQAERAAEQDQPATETKA